MTLGIIGGISWVSTQHYYQLINAGVNARLGRQHSAPLLIASVNFQQIVDAQVREDWQQAGDILVDAGCSLERGGAKVFLIASNTMHLAYDRVAQATKLSGINIITATADRARALGLKRLGLLGTRYTMASPFFMEKYAEQGIEIVIPEAKDCQSINAIIFKELIYDRCSDASRSAFREIVQRLAARGVEGVVLGCTELGGLATNSEGAVALLDTTAIHCAAAVEWIVARARKARLPKP